MSSKKKSRSETGSESLINKKASINKGKPENPQKGFSLLLLFLIILILFVSFYTHRQILNNGFITNFDDNVYILQNEKVKQGLTKENILWALGASENGFWHPVTWISLMADTSFSGFSAASFHKSALIYHSINACLVFAAFLMLTSALIPSLFTALIFAVHPMHVESIAWAAQRKDLLCAMFFWLTIICYAGYIKKRFSPVNTSQDRFKPLKSGLLYFFSLIFFLLSLASKSSMVFLPFLLIIFDLTIFRGLIFPEGFTIGSGCKILLKNKIILFLMSLASGAATILFQLKYDALPGLVNIGLFERIKGFFVFYWLYIKKIFIPQPMACYYPRPESISLISFFMGLIFFIALFRALRKGALKMGAQSKNIPEYASAAAFIAMSLAAYLPVSGIIQVGSFSIADRYSYFINPPVYFILACIFTDFSFSGTMKGSFNNFFFSKKGLLKFLVLIIALALLSSQAGNQGLLWKDGETLFSGAVKAGVPSSLAWNNLGSLKAEKGNIKEALECFKESLQINPNNLKSLSNMANCYSILKKYDLSIPLYEKIIQIESQNRSLILKTGPALAMNYEQTRNHKKAEDLYRKLIRLDPENNIFIWHLAQLLFKTGSFTEADYMTSMFITREFIVPEKKGVSLKNHALKIEAMLQLASIKMSLENYLDAHAILTDVLNINPESAQALTAMAWLTCFSPVPEIVNYSYALELAKSACSIHSEYRPEALANLALIFAARNNFEEAVQANSAALLEAEKLNSNDLAADLSNRQRSLEKKVFPFPEMLSLKQKEANK
jgi:tetratricopeptide (TPR) repeat protein